MYVSRVPESAVAERIQGFRGQSLSDGDLRRRDGSSYALIALDDAAVDRLVDLDDPSELARRAIRPSLVATRDRTVTQPLALAIYEEGVPGFAWWSTLEASWPNATLFAERASPRLRTLGAPEVLSIVHPALRAAAETLGVHLT